MIRWTLLLSFFFAGAEILWSQSTLNVPSALYPNIQSAMNEAGPGDSVLVAPGVYKENLVWPTIDITLRGAGIGKSVIDGDSKGPCLLVNQGSTWLSSIEGFTLTGGSGRRTLTGNGWQPFGGGVYILRESGYSIDFTIRSCQITGNIAADAAGIFCTYASLKLIDTEVSNNTTVVWGADAAAILYQHTYGRLDLENCRIVNNSPPPFVYCRSTINVAWESYFRMKNCRMSGNTSDNSTIAASSILVEYEISECEFINNRTIAPNSAMFRLGKGNWPGTLGTIENSLFANNIVGGRWLLGFGGLDSSSIFNCTFANNVFASGSHTILHFLPGNADIRDIIIYGNIDLNGNASIPPFSNGYNGTPAGPTTFAACNIENGTNLGAGVYDVPPGFVDATKGDYRLLPNSPMVDAGSNSVSHLLSHSDLDGNARLVGNGLDTGCYEGSLLAHHPASRSRVGVSSWNGPVDVLKINGTSGGDYRKVTIGIGVQSNLSMTHPAFASSPLSFVVFGMMDEASPSSVTSVPLGIGEMMFAPEPMITNSALKPLFFTFTDNLSPTNSQFTTSSPTPWTSAPGPAIPFPLTMTFQGVLEESPGVYAATNAIIFEVK